MVLLVASAIATREVSVCERASDRHIERPRARERRRETEIDKRDKE